MGNEMDQPGDRPPDIRSAVRPETTIITTDGRRTANRRTFHEAAFMIPGADSGRSPETELDKDVTARHQSGLLSPQWAVDLPAFFHLPNSPLPTFEELIMADPGRRDFLWHARRVVPGLEFRMTMPAAPTAAA